MENTKRCPRCGETKSISAFSKHRSRPDGLNFYCKNCVNKKGRIYRRTPAGIYNLIKGRAAHRKRHGVLHPKPFELTKDEFIVWYETQSKRCVYCDIPEGKIGFIQELFDKRYRRLEVDCKDNERGYVVDNLVLACHLCNFFKSCIFTFDEMREIAQRFIKPKWQKIEKKIVLEVSEAEVREQYDSMRVVFPEGSKFGVVNRPQT